MALLKTKLATTIVAGLIFIIPAHSDERQLIDIPPSSQTALLTEMRSLVDNLDEMLSALADGDFDEVSRIADFKMGFGHARWQKLLDEGMSPEDVQKQVNQMRSKRSSGQGKGHGQGQGKGHGGGGIFGQGVGRLMPQEVRAMGQQMHVAAGEVSLAAQKAGDSPTVKDYQAVLSNIQEMTAMCSACHSSFKIR